MDTVSGWLFQRSAQNQVDTLGKDLDSAANNVSDTMTRWWNNLVGKTQMPLVELLDRFGIPKGIFPKNVSKYNFEPLEGEEESGALTVTMPFVCEVKFSDGHVVRYNKVVNCNIEKGCLSAIDGIKSQGMFWAEVTDIGVKSMSDKIVFQCSTKKSKNVINYEYPREGVEVKKF